MREFGDRRIEASRTGLPGLIVAKTSLNPFEVVKQLREHVIEKPWDLRYILKIVPVARVVPTDLEKIAAAALEQASKIGEDETFKVDVHIRLSELGKKELIECIAPRIARKVNLSNPDWIIRIDVIGDLTGVSVIKPEDEVSIIKLRRISKAS